MKVVLDLDRTIWDTIDRFGNDIWAKQMLEPFKVENGQVVDDVYSVCKLRHGITQFLESASLKNYELSFLSAGAIANRDLVDQPSVILLKTFGLWDFFNGFRALEYKTLDKAAYLKKIAGEIIFFDDSPDILESVGLLPTVTTIDSSHIYNWSESLEKYCG